jgi:hypothetical protein
LKEDDELDNKELLRLLHRDGLCVVQRQWGATEDFLSKGVTCLDLNF